jgi:hypothetical protein
MDPAIIQFKGHIIEIHEHPIYRDFEYVIKTLDGKVLAASDHQYKMFEDAEVNAKMLVANR